MSRVLKKVHITSILSPPRQPLCLRTLAIANHLKRGGTLPPLKVLEMSKYGHPGCYMILDGRHRYTAYRLVEREWVLVRYGVQDHTTQESSQGSAHDGSQDRGCSRPREEKTSETQETHHPMG